MYNKIKKQNGESFAKVLRDHHNGILEVNNILEIVKHAGKTGKDAENNLKYYTSLLLSEDEIEVEEVRNPFELLDDAGYDSWHANSAKLQNSIRKHFVKSEELCTFGTNRFSSYHMINAVKKNVANIKREDFVGTEKREDEYGTSVISIQVSKSGGFISIKNRYNHIVPNCDNTFRSNPDNIIEGLANSIQKFFNVSFSKKSDILAEGYSLVNKSVFKVNLEVGGILYGDTGYVKDGNIVDVSAENNEYLFDYFIFNSQLKTFRLVDETIVDSFPHDYNNVYGGSKSVYVKKHNIYDGDVMLIESEK